MRQAFNHPVAFAGACALVLAVALGGCGGGSDSTTPVGPPLPPAKPKESINGAAKRFQKAYASGDCEKVAKLYPLGPRKAPPPTKARCKALKRVASRFASWRVSGEAAYKGGGVIDWAAGPRTIATVLVVDSDGRYHLVFTDGYQAKPSIGTKFAPAFDKAAKKAAAALSKRDCKAYLAVAYRRSGIGSLSQKEACKAIKRNLFYITKKNAPTVKPPRRLGGNRTYAFYSYGTPAASYTMVMVRESDEGLPKGLPKLPPGSARYSFFRAFHTNSRQAARAAGTAGNGSQTTGKRKSG